MINSTDLEAFEYYNEEDNKIYNTLDKLAEECHRASYNSGWWHDPSTGEEFPTEGFLGAHVIGCKLGLIHSEVSEAMEGHRKSLKDDKLPQYDAIDVELVDALIRILDLLGMRGAPVDAIYGDKMSFNVSRPDHKVEMRKKGGKLY